MTSDMSHAAQRCLIVAFTAPGGPGRTAALVNVACVLAAAGKRVLILDEGVGVPRVHDYLRQFQADRVWPGHLLDEDLAVALFGPAAGRDGLTACRYQLPMDSGDIDAIAVASGSPRPYRSDGQDAALRHRIRATGYDHVLIDIAAGVTPATIKRLVYLCDTVVVCFHPQLSEVSQAAALAGTIAELALFRLEILAVTLQFDDQDPNVARRTRDRIRTAFAGLATDEVSTPQVSTTVVEIPYRPGGVVFDHIVEVLYDESGAPVPAAYARIASTITAGEVDRMHPVPPRVREGYRYSLGVGSLSAAPRIFLAYAVEDRLWADWIRSLLESSGARVGPLPADDSWLAGPLRPAVLVVGNPRLARSPTGRHAIGLTERLADTPGLADRFDMLLVQVSGGPVGPPLGDLPQISFVDCDETLARRRLLRHFVLFDRSEPDTGEYPVSFPGTAAPPRSRSKLPPRNQRFVGRGVELEHIRDRFLSPGGLVVCTLTGPPGTGKSQIALEYAHRFTTDYDLQWWIPAEDERSVRASLTALADEMRLPSSPDRPRAALEALRAHPRYQRWLLIYDNVSNVETVAELLPVGDAGHVIVTTRQPSPDGMTVGGLDAEDSAELLGELVPDLSAADAELVALQMDQLPLAVRLAAAWMSESATVMRRAVSTRASAAAWAATEFQTRTARFLDDQLPGSPLAAALAVILQTLAEEDLGRVATRLAQMCSWLSSEGVALRLLRSAPMVQALADAAEDGQALVLDPLELDQVLRAGQRYGLFEMNWERPAMLTMHRLVQELLRDAMALGESEVRRGEVLHALAAFAPTDPEPEDPQDIADFAELQRHIEVSGALGSQDVSVRRWLVDQVNYLMRTPSPETWQFAIDLGARVLEGWHPSSQAESSLKMRLEFQLGALHWQRREDMETLLKSVDALLDRQQQLLGPTHPRTLKTWRSKGETLGIRGQFADACAAEQRTLGGFRERLGDYHPDTRRAANNLARWYFLAGDVFSALELERENYAIRMALFGPDHLDVCWSACNLGIYLRELGRYPEAIRIFDEAVERVGALQPDGGHPVGLLIRWHRAIAYRNAGDPSKALEENAENLRRFQDLYGPHGEWTVKCKLSIAIDYHLTGDSMAAECYAEECLAGYRRSDPGYRYTALPRLNLAVFRRGLGQTAQAAAISAEARDELADWLGADHPWTLAATMNHAHAIALNGDPDEGHELLRSTYNDCLDYLPPDHPYTRCAADNLARDIADWRSLLVDLP